MSFIIRKKIALEFFVLLFSVGSIMPSVDVGTESKTRQYVWNSSGGVLSVISVATGIFSVAALIVFFKEPENDTDDCENDKDGWVSLFISGVSGVISLATGSSSLFCFWRGYKNSPFTEKSLNKEISKSERKNRAMKERLEKLRVRKQKKLEEELHKKEAETESLRKKLSGLKA